MSKFPLTELAVKMYCPDNIVLIDDTGLPSIMVYIPAFKNSDVLTGGNDSTHPAFIVDGVQIPGFYYSKYQNITHNGKAYSLPGEDPQTLINFETAYQSCEAKGYGWHISTAVEWAAVALWCKKNGFLPLGNNDNGKDTKEDEFKAIKTSQNTARVATGTGPLTWSHNHSESGIWDMNGNVWEWQAGIRLVRGELQIFENNGAANFNNPHDQTSVFWRAIKASDGSLVEPECLTTDTDQKASGETVRLDFRNGKFTFSNEIIHASNTSNACSFYEVTFDQTIGEATKSLLRALALLPEEGATSDVYGSAYMHCNNLSTEVMMFRGGSFGNGNTTGIFAINLSNGRNGKNDNMGFRSAYIPNLEAGMPDDGVIELY